MADGGKAGEENGVAGVLSNKTPDVTDLGTHSFYL